MNDYNSNCITLLDQQLCRTYELARDTSTMLLRTSRPNDHADNFYR